MLQGQIHSFIIEFIRSILLDNALIRGPDEELT